MTARVAINGIELAVAEDGPDDGPVVVLLHGFPELGFSWRHQVGPLAAAGYRVLVPDMRGFGDSDAPDAAAEEDAGTDDPMAVHVEDKEGLLALFSIRRPSKSTTPAGRVTS